MIKESESMMVEFQQKEMRDMNKQLKHDNEKLIQEIKDLKVDYALEKKIAEDKHRVEVEDL
jgi:cell division protein FtsB